MFRLILASAICALALAPLAAAEDPPAPAPSTAAAPTAPEAPPKFAYMLMYEGPPSTEVAAFERFEQRNLIGPWHPDLTQRVLVVFLEPKAASNGAAYAFVDYKLECYPHARKVTAFTTYTDAGKVLKKAPKLPPQAATWFDESELNRDHGNQCRYAVPGREVPPMPGNNEPKKDRPNLFLLGSPVVETVPEAIGVAREHAAQVAAARQLPQTSAYAVGDSDADPAWGVVILDTATLKPDASGNIHVSWTLVRNPTKWNKATHIRATHKLDCTAREAIPETIAGFDADNRLIRFHAGGRAEKFKSMQDINLVFDKICDGASIETGPTVPTLAEALTTARAKLVP